MNLTLQKYKIFVYKKDVYLFMMKIVETVFLLGKAQVYITFTAYNLSFGSATRKLTGFFCQRVIKTSENARRHHNVHH